MFVRYSLTAAAQDVAQRFGIEVPESYHPLYNAAPSHLLPVVTDESPKGLSFFYWGTPPQWANQKSLGEKIINTRAELIGEKAVIKKRLREKRCLIPADGFYLWKKTGKKSLIPHRVTLADKDMFSIAALWEEYDDEKDERNHTFTVITTTANDHITMLDERMPLILDRAKEKLWLTSGDEGTLLGLLRPYEGPLTFYSVAPLINVIEKNDPRVIRPAPAADQFGNLSLFD